ncbi:MAG: epoxyqueuosine reductase QueH [Coriobacteriales bacterium]|nr:epoxyqueuosine reductase QueH [Coriobacteriales bacterium]
MSTHTDDTSSAKGSVPDSDDSRVLLHCCCAPCTQVPLASLQDEGWQVSLYFYNPNIHPAEEYAKRLCTLREYAEANAVPLALGPYDPQTWEETVGIHGGPYPIIEGASDAPAMRAARTARCRACYQLRFEALAAHAEATACHGLDTTLTISPYQCTREAQSALAQCAESLGLTALATDWRSFYAEATRRSRVLGMYRQNYCGCHYSEQEARLEKQARKRARQAAQQAGLSLSPLQTEGEGPDCGENRHGTGRA